MGPEQQKLLQQAEDFIGQLFSTKVSPSFVYHTLEHTREVVKAAEMLASYYAQSDRERLIILLAAWFHDAGYSGGVVIGHEDLSARVASDWLAKQKVDPEIIEAAKGCIMATKMPQTPLNLMEQIVCDADLFHLGTEAFDQKNKLLREEINNLQEHAVGKKEWRQLNIEFLQRHRYFTDFCRERLEPVKQEHLDELMDKLGKKDRKQAEGRIVDPAKVINPLDPTDVQHLQKTESQKEEKEKAKEKEKEKEREKDKYKEADKRPERGITSMFRIVSENHVSLSQMADNKANIMISVNTIVISIMVTLLLGKLQFYPEYIIPTIILVTVCLGAVVFAILATRPNISKGSFSREDIAQKNINLLFFGNFYRVSVEDYEWGMKEMIKDREYLYGSMIKDIYFLGVVLARKYKFLRISYNIFMFGLILAILSFAVAFFFSEQGI